MSATLRCSWVIQGGGDGSGRESAKIQIVQQANPRHLYKPRGLKKQPTGLENKNDGANDTVQCWATEGVPSVYSRDPHDRGIGRRRKAIALPLHAPLFLYGMRKPADSQNQNNP